MWVSAQYHRGDFRIVSIVIINVIVENRQPRVSRDVYSPLWRPATQPPDYRAHMLGPYRTVCFYLPSWIGGCGANMSRSVSRSVPPDAYLFSRELSRETDESLELKDVAK